MSTKSASHIIIWQLICLILLVSCCHTHALQDFPLDILCSCECQHDNQVIDKDSSAPSTFCENENFIKCCSAYEASPASIQTSSSRKIQDNSSRAMTTIFSEPRAIRVRILDHLPSKMTGLPVGFSLPEHVRPNNQRIHHQQADTASLPMITNDDESKATKEHQETQDEADIQRLIDESISFESQKIWSMIPASQDRRKVLRKRNNFLHTTESQEVADEDKKYDGLTKLIGCIESEKAGSSYAVTEHEFHKQDSNTDGKSSVPSMPVKISKKVADLFRQKTSLETLLALDRASVQAADGNTPNSASKVNLSEDADTSIMYSLQEGIKNGRRLGRSRLTTFENNHEVQNLIAQNSRSEIDSRESQILTSTTATPVSRFKRPPRVLPKRTMAVIPNTENKYRNSRERAFGLYNRSDESKSRASLIIKSRERSMIKLSPLANHEIENDSALQKTDEADKTADKQRKNISAGGNGDPNKLERPT